MAAAPGWLASEINTGSSWRRKFCKPRVARARGGERVEPIRLYQRLRELAIAFEQRCIVAVARRQQHAFGRAKIRGDIRLEHARGRCLDFVRRDLAAAR